MVPVIPLILLLFLLIMGVPVAISLAIAGSFGIYIISGFDVLLGILTASPGSSLKTYELMTIPMFILMSEFMGESGISDQIFTSIAKWTGRIKGGVGIATVVSGAVFGAVSGSSTAAAATLSRISIPAMINHGYDKSLAAGIVAIAGTIAMLIPPSVIIVFYGLLSGVDIAGMLIAGIIPGLLVTLAVSINIRILMRWYPGADKELSSYSWKEKIYTLKTTGPCIFLFFLVTGLIYAGIATPVESSAMGALGAMFLFFKSGKLRYQNFKNLLFNTCSISAMIGLLIVCANIFGYYITLTGTTKNFVNYISSMGLSPYTILALIIFLYFILGMFLDLISILILTTPLTVPLMKSLGFDPIWFGIIVVLLCEVGLVTPPVGINVFVVSKSAKIPVEIVFRGVYAHIVAVFAVVLLITIFPEIVMWLPGTM